VTFRPRRFEVVAMSATLRLRRDSLLDCVRAHRFDVTGPASPSCRTGAMAKKPCLLQAAAESALELASAVPFLWSTAGRTPGATPATGGLEDGLDADGQGLAAGVAHPQTEGGGHALPAPRRETASQCGPTGPPAKASPQGARSGRFMGPPPRPSTPMRVGYIEWNIAVLGLRPCSTPEEAASVPVDISGVAIDGP
jgi:hypothetical protein